mgnify:CR=1 FL=1
MLSEARGGHAFDATDAVQLFALELVEFVTPGLLGWRTGKRAGILAGVTQDAIGRGCDQSMVGGVGERVKEHLDREWRAT